MPNQKTILITGGTGKLGSVFVKHFLSLGHIVIFTSTNPDTVDRVIAESKLEWNQKLYGVAVDLLDETSITTIVDFLLQHRLQPNCLVNNARNMGNLKVEQLPVPRKNWLNEFTINVIAAYELSLALANMAESKLENIINIASMYGVVPFHLDLYHFDEKQAPIHYSTTKAALIHLTKELSIRFAPKGIRVNSISYGGVEGRVNEEFKKRYGRLCPMGRMLKEEEIIGAIDFLVSDRSVGMTGHNLVVDGGWTVW